MLTLHTLDRRRAVVVVVTTVVSSVCEGEHIRQMIMMLNDASSKINRINRTQLTSMLPTIRARLGPLESLSVPLYTAGTETKHPWLPAKVLTL